MSGQPESSRLSALFESALRDYEQKTKISLANHPLAEQLENCHSVEDLAAILQGQARANSAFQGSDRIMKSIKSTLSVLYNLSAIAALGDGIGLALPPTKAIRSGLGVLLHAAKDVITSEDALTDLLESIEHFLKRLDIYTKIPSTAAMDELIVKIMVEVLSTLALATKELKQGRSKKFIKSLFGGERGAEAVLQRLDRLTQDEARTTAAETLKVVYGLVQDLNGKASGDDVLKALEIIHQSASDVKRSKRDKLKEDIESWLSAPDPWKNYHMALRLRHKESAAWFLQGDTFSKWKSSGPSSLLWISGKRQLLPSRSTL
jgi:hypothetical protein